ncbi:MAG: secondary thiamine-phosphate synthase enzyme YjbQ [Spirochaetaceae bacterium]|nr:secondary thiamine-phosphate synthase enzyme YjbQ [Spirochaetaceae bacterium]
MAPQQIQLRTGRRSEFIEIISSVVEAVRASGVVNGVCTVYVPHTTAGVTINENADPSVVRDMITHLEHLVPTDGAYTHAEGNSDSHIKAGLMGSSVTVPIADGRPLLGTWQGIYFCEFDGPRTRSYVVTVIGGA